MTDRELRKLSRKDLLKLLVSVSRERDALQAELETVKAALQNRQIRIKQAGSIAEAALQLSGVFDAAQTAAEQYLENIRQRSANIEKVCAKREAACAKLEEQTRQKCQLMIAEAEEKSEAHCGENTRRPATFYEDHREVKEPLASGGKS